MYEYTRILVHSYFHVQEHIGGKSPSRRKRSPPAVREQQREHEIGDELTSRRAHREAHRKPLKDVFDKDSVAVAILPSTDAIEQSVASLEHFV